MSEKTGIKWADSTISFWSGCTKVSAGCANCYAEALATRFDTFGKWGRGAPRRLHESAFKLAARLNRFPWVCDKCEEPHKGWTVTGDVGVCGICGARGTFHRRRIFVNSLSDVWDFEVPLEWQARTLETIRTCPEVTFILCTKRPENALPLLDTMRRREWPAMPDLRQWIDRWFSGEPPKNVILLTSVENQALADQRILALLRIPVACHGLSLEPLLGPVTLPQCNGRPNCPFGNIQGHSDLPLGGIKWLIIGGESGPKARPCNLKWIRSLKEQGQAAGAAVFVKQLGSNSYVKAPFGPLTGKGDNPTEWPADLRVQEWPKGF